MTSDVEGPGSGPDPRMDDLTFFQGRWDAPGVFHATPFGPGNEIDMEIDAQTEQRGRWLTVRTEEQATPDNPHPSTARSMWGYDTTTGQFVADWFDSNGGRARQTSAGWEGEVLRLEGTITMNGTSVPLGDTFTRRGTDTFHHIGEIDLGDGWIPVDEEEARRVVTA